MITVKHVSQNKVESVFLAQSVQFVPERGIVCGVNPNNTYDLPEGITVHMPDESLLHYGFDKVGGPDVLQSKVYVMNEHGKTVATYIL